MHARETRAGRRAVLSALLAVLLLAGAAFAWWMAQPVLRITDWKTGEVYAQRSVRVGDTLYFGWIHSLEKIPWHEYYHIDKDLHLVLDTISFPAFGAGIPENKGTVCYVEDGMIVMSGIGQVFPEFDWLNSHMATQEILVGEEYLTRGSELPDHTRLRLAIERRFHHGR